MAPLTLIATQTRLRSTGYQKKEARAVIAVPANTQRARWHGGIFTFLLTPTAKSSAIFRVLSARNGVLVREIEPSERGAAWA